MEIDKSHTVYGFKIIMYIYYVASLKYFSVYLAYTVLSTTPKKVPRQGYIYMNAGNDDVVIFSKIMVHSKAQNQIITRTIIHRIKLSHI